MKWISWLIFPLLIAGIIVIILAVAWLVETLCVRFKVPDEVMIITIIVAMIVSVLTLGICLIFKLVDLLTWFEKQDNKANPQKPTKADLWSEKDYHNWPENPDL